MRRSLLVLISLSLSAALAASPALAGPGKGKNKGKSKTEISVSIETRSHYGVVVIGSRERQIVRSYYSDPSHGLPPGLAKKSSLPPGLQKHLSRTGHLPPGLEKRNLPSDLSYRLPRLDDRYERTIVGRDLVLLDRKTGLILDVMQEIFDVPVDATLEKVGARRLGH